jgi:DegV family protein with EDD domain
MPRPRDAIRYLDAQRLLRALSAGIGNVFQRREYLNRINVFPVPDGDTGTNMAFTFKTILEATRSANDNRVDELLDHVAEAALDGARGNSGAIMAQYFHGFREATRGRRVLTATAFAEAAMRGAESAWTAMSQPVSGTLPSVLEDFSRELSQRVQAGVEDIRLLMKHGLERARRSLAETPEQLPALKQAGVVDAGGQGFVDLVEGIWEFIEHGSIAAVEPGLAADLGADLTGALQPFDVGGHRYCTECVIEAAAAPIDRNAVMQRLEGLDCSSLVVAGGRERVRVHVHVNNPAEVYLVCEAFGSIRQQKADDMERQHGLLDHAGEVAVVADSGADIPPEELERLHIHMVPVRLSFGDREYLDRVSLSASEFYDMLADATEAPLTSQPPAQDFARVYALLTSHGYSVVSVGLSQKLSGTTAAALQAAGRADAGDVRVVDSLSATAGQGLLAMAAAEAAMAGMSADEIVALLQEWIPQTRVIGIADDLAYAVRGGRVPAWIKRLFGLLHLNPVLTANREGGMGLAGFHIGKGAHPGRLARSAVKLMRPGAMYRVAIAHANNPNGAAETRRHILEAHGRVHSCHVTEAGPALGAHFGPGGLIVGLMPHPGVLV